MSSVNSLPIFSYQISSSTKGGTGSDVGIEGVDAVAEGVVWGLVERTP